MTILVLTNKPLMTTSNGYDLRVWYLSQALRQHERLVLLHFPFQPDETPVKPDIDANDLFDEVCVTAAPEDFKPSFRRHLRLREDRFLSWGYPAFQQQVIHQISAICTKYRITTIIAFGSGLAGLLRHLAGTMKILLDVCDSMALTIERGLQLERARLTLSQRVWIKLRQARWGALEARLPGWFSQVVTINEMDTEKIRQLADTLGAKHENLSTIPNGVAADFETAYQEGPCARRGVAFWGNLSFPPNEDAVRFFYHQVFLPYLKPSGIELCIIGSQPAPWLIEASRHEPGLRLTGFVQNLRERLTDYPIMINPMRMGSGMKNKVIEAHALGLAVVSTRLGMESIDGAVAGQSYLNADNAVEFHEAIRSLLDDEPRRLRLLRSARRIVADKYTWDIVGSQWRELVTRLSAPAP